MFEHLPDVRARQRGLKTTLGMALRRNILANTAGQLYATLIGILMVPLYIRSMGAEAYGLVGFYTMLQGWFMLLDMGLTPTIGRETARFNGGATDPLALRSLLRAFEGIFVAVALVGALALIAGAPWVAGHWLEVQQLDIFEVQHAVMLMAPIVALRWVCGLYRGAVTGFEKIVWLSGFNIVIATLRFVLVLPYMMVYGATPTQFFVYQLAIAIVEVLWLGSKTYRLLPAVQQRVHWQFQPLRGVMRFALSAAFTSAVWVLATQADKLVVSGAVPLAEFGYFTLAVLVASGIAVLSSPITGAMLPRLTRLSAMGDESGLIRLYRGATQGVAVVVVPVVLLLSVFPEQVLTAWTGSETLATRAAPVLTLYAVGNGILALAAFPYFLQVARGDLNLHVIGNLIFVLLFVPLLLLAVGRFGMLGAGYAWIVANLVPFLAFLPLVHKRFLKGLHLRWLTQDIGIIVLLPALAAGLLKALSWPSNRPGIALMLAATYGALVLVAAACSSNLRSMLEARAAARAAPSA